MRLRRGQLILVESLTENAMSVAATDDVGSDVAPVRRESGCPTRSTPPSKTMYTPARK